MQATCASDDANLLETLRQCDIRCPREFAVEHATHWGFLYTAPDNPQSHDSNHAVITDLGFDADVALAEISRSFAEAGVTPRLRPAHLTGEQQTLRPALDRQGYRVEEDDACLWMLLKNPASDDHAPSGLEIRRVCALEPALLALVHSEGPRPWGEQTLRRQLANEGLHLFVGYIGAEAVSMAVLSQVGVLARVDDVRTAPAHRCRGYSLAVMRHLVRFHLVTSAKSLYLVTDNPAAARNYQRCGFEDLMAPWESWQATRPVEAPSPKG